MITKPTIYRIELYPDSFRNEPIAGFCSTTPFVSFHKGDTVDPHAWSDGNEESYSNKGMVAKGKILEVAEVRHLMMTTREHILQSISIKVIEKERTY